jgi:uncharacterized protein (DUF2461 family)
MHGAAHGIPGAVHYLHLDASGLMVASGNYMMQSEDLERYRHAVADDASGEELTEILAALRRRRSLQVGPGGTEPLKTVPRGFPRDHPRAELLRQKGLIAMRTRPHQSCRTGRGYGASSWRPLRCVQISPTGLADTVGGTSES